MADPVGEVVDACQALMAVRARVRAVEAERAAWVVRRRAAQEQRDSAYRELRAQGLSAARIAEVVGERLRAAGFTSEDLARLGVTVPAIRKATEPR